jgi:cysteinyl-tRNA synthetase
MTQHSIRLYNTLTGRKESLRTHRPDRVTLYVCGPTVYNYAHIGNARPAVVFDVLARLLRHDYPEVRYVRNFTDVDDKIQQAAAARGVPIATLTQTFIDAYHEDMQALSVLPPDAEPRVTEHIADIIELVQTLIERGHAYVNQGHVLFHVPSYPAYGALSGRQPESLRAGARIEVAPYKRDSLDFVLWKPSTPDQPGWPSPWGRGRPGWHIECTAMIGRHLGFPIDIHGGGQDLIFPHHENEIAQGTCAYGTTYCHTWVHNSFVTVDGDKMSKSRNNVLLVRDLLRQAPGEAIRLALLATHYRNPLDWNTERLRQASQTLRRWYTRLAPVADQCASPQLKQPDARVLEALRDDLNVSKALSRLHELSAALDSAASERERRQLAARLTASGALLGLLQQPPALALRELQTPTSRATTPTLSRQQIEQRLAERDQARRAGDYRRADALREELRQAGIEIWDTREGSQWRAIGATVSPAADSARATTGNVFNGEPS